jgi:hypothetical protein
MARLFPEDFELTLEEFEKDNGYIRAVKITKSGNSFSGQEMVMLNEILRQFDELQITNDFVEEQIILLNENISNLNIKIDELKDILDNHLHNGDQIKSFIEDEK